MARQQGSNASYYGIILGLVLCGWAIGLFASFLLSHSSSPDYSRGGVLGVIIGAGVFLLIRRPLMMARFKRNFQARQQTLELPIRMEISPDQLIYEVGGVTQLARWPVVDELFRSHDYWIFLAQSHSMFAPRRLFSSQDDEKHFVTEALARMSPEARSRSHDAERFAGVKHAT